MATETIRAGQLILDSTTPPPDRGFYKINDFTTGHVGKLVINDPTTNAASTVVTATSSAQGVAGPATFTRPSGFRWDPSLPNVFAFGDGMGRYGCSHRPEDILDPSMFTRTMYVDRAGGNDANSGATWTLRKQSIKSAIDLASAGGIPTRILVFSNGGKNVYTRAFGISGGLNTASAVPIMLEAMEGRISHGSFDDLVYTLDGSYANVWVTTRSVSNRCVNPSIVDPANANAWKEYVWVTGADTAAKKAAVRDTEGSWTVDGTAVYVHPHGNAPASNSNVRIYIGSANFNWSGNQHLFVRGFDFEGGQEGAIKVFGGSTNIIVADDSTFRWAYPHNLDNSGTVVIDAAQILGCKLFAAFNCSADLSGKDGFNLHSEGAVLPAGLFVNCSGWRNGRQTPAVSCNGLTAHDGISAISIGGNWQGSRGGQVAIVTDNTHMWCVGDVAGSSPGDVPNGGVLTASGFNAQTGAATLWLEECRDIGTEFGVVAATGGTIYTRRHRGTGARTGNVQAF